MFGNKYLNTFWGKGLKKSWWDCKHKIGVTAGEIRVLLQRGQAGGRGQARRASQTGGMGQ